MVTQILGQMSMFPTPTIPDRPAAAIRCALSAIAASLFALAAAAQNPPDEPPQAADSEALELFCVLPESYAMRPAIFVLVPGAQRVGFTLFRQSPIGLDPYTRSEVRSLRLTWFECFLRGQEAATRHLRTLEPKFYRDQNKVIQYAHLHSESQLTASILISPEFVARFEDTLGKELYVAIPDRFNVFVFPALPNSISISITQKMIRLHKEALYPVCREVFRRSKTEIRVIGEF